MRSLLVCSFLLAIPLVAVKADAASPPPLSDEEVLAGSPAALATENRVADEHDLTRLRDAVELRRFIGVGLLMKIVDTDGYFIDATLGEIDSANAALYAYARPWVKTFLDDFAIDPARPKGFRYKITSLVRTVEYQEKLRKRYPAATSATVPGRRSSHLTGSTVDISTKEMPDAEKARLRKKLAALERRGLIQATEEQWTSLCFHVMVFPEYSVKR